MKNQLQNKKRIITKYSKVSKGKWLMVKAKTVYYFANIKFHTNLKISIQKY